MTVSLNNLYNFFGNKRVSKRVGRGIGSGKGKTCGRGVKGQKARAGVSIRWFEGGQTSLVKRLFKRGFNSLNKKHSQIVSISKINELVDLGLLNSGDLVDREFLVKMGIVNDDHSRIKLLGAETLRTNLQFNFHEYSNAAKVSIANSNGVFKG